MRQAKIAISKLKPFPGNPYKVRDDIEMDNLTQSIRESGILTPLIVRPIENTDEYEVISGHRRLHAAQKAGVSEVPALIYALDRDTAAIAVVDSNLHREHILPSEKAFAYKLKLEAMKHQGQRKAPEEVLVDQILGVDTSCQVGTKLRTDELLASSVRESARQIQRYIRLTCLVPELLQKVDEGKIALTPAVELSYLTEKEQQGLLEIMESEDCTPSLSQAIRMKQLSQTGALSPDRILSILSQPKANQKEMLKLPMDQVRRFVPGADPEKTKDFILKACEHYQKFLARQREAR